MTKEYKSLLDYGQSSHHTAQQTAPLQAQPNVLHQTNTLVDARGKTHGDFVDHARITVALKEVVRTEIYNRVAKRQQKDLSPTQLEAVDMILHKIGRIVAGDPDVHDHWDDIAGYATITRERIGK